MLYSIPVLGVLEVPVVQRTGCEESPAACQEVSFLCWPWPAQISPQQCFSPLVMDAARRVGLSLVLGRSHPSLGRCLSVCKACVPPI